MKKSLVFLLIMCLSLSALLTGCGNSTVNLNDYLDVTVQGYDGYGSVSVDLDYDKIISDFADRLTDKNLSTEIFGDKTPALAAAFVFATQNPFEFSYEKSNNLKNGDKIDFTWKVNQDAVATLKKILKVNFKCDSYSYKVKDLKKVENVDPFKNIRYETAGISGVGRISTDPKAIINDSTELELTFDKEKNGTLSNGDTVKFSIKNENSDDYYARTYGIKLTKKSSNVKIDTLDYYPVENPKEIFDNLAKSDITNAEAAVKNNYDYWRGLFSYCNVGEVKAEYIGSFYYYNDKPDFTASNYSEISSLFMIFRVTSDKNPNAWYTYANPHLSAHIKYIKQDDGTLTKRTSLVNKYTYQKEFSAQLGDYYFEGIPFFEKLKIPTYFTYNNIRYIGHQKLEECIEAINYYNITNSGKQESQYNHMIATDDLKKYVKEF